MNRWLCIIYIFGFYIFNAQNAFAYSLEDDQKKCEISISKLRAIDADFYIQYKPLIFNEINNVLKNYPDAKTFDGSRADSILRIFAGSSGRGPDPQGEFDYDYGPRIKAAPIVFSKWLKDHLILWARFNEQSKDKDALDATHFCFILPWRNAMIQLSQNNNSNQQSSAQVNSSGSQPQQPSPTNKPGTSILDRYLTAPKEDCDAIPQSYNASDRQFAVSQCRLRNANRDKYAANAAATKPQVYDLAAQQRAQQAADQQQAQLAQLAQQVAQQARRDREAREAREAQQAAEQQRQQSMQTANQNQARADQARKDQRKRHEPENEASHCIQADFGGLYGGMKNTCDFKVWYTYCGYRPKENSWLTGMSCEKQSFGSDSVSPGRTSAAHTKGVEMLYWFACKEPAWTVDTEFVAGQGIRGRCHTVGGN